MPICSKCQNTADVMHGELCEYCYTGRLPGVYKVRFISEEQSFIIEGSVRDESSSSVKIIFDVSLFEYMSESYRLGDDYVEIDTEKVFLDFKLDGNFSRDISAVLENELDQVWEFSGLKPGLNVIYIRVCHPREQSDEEIISPSTSELYVIEFPVAIHIGEQRKVKDEALAVMPDKSFVLANHLPPETEVSDLSCNSVSFWGFTREALEQEGNRSISDDEWVKLCEYIDDRMAGVFENQSHDETQTAIEFYPEEDDDEEGSDDPGFASFSNPVRILYSFTPETDSLPHFIYINRSNLDEVTNAQWDHVQEWIAVRQQRVLTGYLPFIFHRALEDANASPTPLIQDSKTFHALDVLKATSFLKEKLDAPDVEFYAAPLLLIQGARGVAVVDMNGNGWYPDAEGKLPINYFSPNGLTGYLDVLLGELVPLIDDEKIGLSNFVTSDFNLLIWQTYAADYPQDKDSLVAALESN